MLRYLIAYCYMRCCDAGHHGATQYARRQVSVARKQRAERIALRGRA